MRKLLVFLGLLIPELLLGQTPATVTGLITDASGSPATSGFVQFDIQPKSPAIQYFVAGTTTIAPQFTQCGINASGQIQNIGLTGACLVWGNDIITPGNTTYKVTFAPGGNAVNTISGECITGSVYSLNSPVFCPIVQINPQQTIVRANPFQTNIIPITNNTFNIGGPNLQYAAVYAGQFFINGTPLSPIPFGLGTNNTWTGINTFTNTLNFTTLISRTVNPATSGVLRFANGDVISWRNSANSGNLTLEILGAQGGNFPPDQLFYRGRNDGNALIESDGFASNDGNLSIAAAGFLRMGIARTLNWRNAAATADLALSVRGVNIGNVPANTLVWDSPNVTPFMAGAFIQNGPETSVAAAGALRLHSGDSINWRNNANSADLLLAKNTSDQLTYGGAKVVTQSGAVTPGHAVTVQSDGVIQDGGVFPVISVSTVYNTVTSAVGANIGTTTMITVPGSDTNYRFSVHIAQTNTTAGCIANATVTVNLTYTEAFQNSSRTSAIGLAPENAPATALVATFSLGQNVGPTSINTAWGYRDIRARASTVIQYAVTYGACGGAPEANYSIAPVLIQE